MKKTLNTFSLCSKDLLRSMSMSYGPTWPIESHSENGTKSLSKATKIAKYPIVLGVLWMFSVECRYNVTVTNIPRFFWENCFPTQFHWNGGKRIIEFALEILLTVFFFGPREKVRKIHMDSFLSHVFQPNKCSHFNYKSTPGYNRWEEILKRSLILHWNA